MNASAVGHFGQRLHARDEGRNANAGANPDLALWFALKVEATIRAFYRHHILQLHSIDQRPGVVAQGLDDERQAAIIGPGG